MTIQIAIDGPSGAGKSTVAKALARALSFTYLDTGALYRTVGVAVRNAGADPKDGDAVAALLPGIRVSLSYDADGTQHVSLNGTDVSKTIRENDISAYASAVSRYPAVRTFLLSLQRDIANTQNVIMDGRDIGTVILPNAQLKVFLFASPEARARRRVTELAEKGQSVTYEQIFAEMQARDAQDAGRETAPCVPAPDAVMMDNSDMTIEENVSAIRALLRERGLC